jgi:hypothetical protein
LANRFVAIIFEVSKSKYMRTIIEYQCEICKDRYNSAERALACEAQGRFDPSKYIVGCMFEYHHSGFVGIFAIPPDGAKPFTRNEHLGTIAMWACRNNMYGDSLGAEECGGNDLLYSYDEYLENWTLKNRITKKYLGCPEFERMVSFLRSQNIAPCYFNETGELILLYVYP